MITASLTAVSQVAVAVVRVIATTLPPEVPHIWAMSTWYGRRISRVDRRRWARITKISTLGADT